MQRWHQTGQKYAGEPDIAKTFLLNHNLVLWILVLVTHVNLAQRLARTCLPQAPRHIAFGAAIALSLAALGFKVAYTNADAPELLKGLPIGLLRPLLEMSLIPQARGTFVFIFVTAILTIFPAFRRQKVYILHPGTVSSPSVRNYSSRRIQTFWTLCVTFSRCFLLCSLVSPTFLSSSSLRCKLTLWVFLISLGRRRRQRVSSSSVFRSSLLADLIPSPRLIYQMRITGSAATTSWRLEYWHSVAIGPVRCGGRHQRFASC